MKNSKFYSALLLSIVLFLFMANGKSLAQQNQNAKGVEKAIDYSTTPAWIAMMDDPNVNYYEAMKAFNTYWENRTRPEGDDVIPSKASKEELREKEERDNELAKMTPQQRQEHNEMAFQYKRFQNWSHVVFPFVQDDGRILSADERMAIWNKQQEEINKQKKSNK
jgi:hypothetical protein